MTIEAIVDSRERALIAELNSRGEDMAVTIGSLPLGDIGFELNGELVHLVERKTIGDLAASIQDGRYREQGERLADVSAPVTYLIEGDLRAYRPHPGTHAPTRDAVMGAMASLQHKKGFFVYRSLNVAESAQWLVKTAKKLAEAHGQDGRTAVRGKSVFECASRRRIGTREEAEEVMLSVLPGVSAATASAVLEGVGGLRGLLADLDGTTDKLRGVHLTSKSGKKRRLGKNTVKVITDLLGAGNGNERGNEPGNEPPRK